VPTLELLLAAAPSTATAVDNSGNLPLHVAARHGHMGAMQLLLAAAPEAAVRPGHGGKLPLELALGSSTVQMSAARQAAARCLLPAGPTATVLAALRRVGPERGWPLLSEAISARVPLTEEEWDVVPFTCPGLGQALPAALALEPSVAAIQARHLVRHLLRSDLLRVRALALCMARQQRRMGAALPADLVQKMLCLALLP